MTDISSVEEMSSVNIEAGPASSVPPVNSLGSRANTEGPTGQSLDFILDVPLTITVELGTSKMTIREVLQLAQGSVIPTSKFAGEPLEILINGRLISRGEVVVVNEKYGVRLTDVVSPTDHIK